MATKPTKKPSGSVNVSLRLDPKTKFLIDLISRSHKRTITGVIEWAVERMARQESPPFFAPGDTSLMDIAEMCWPTEEPVRLMNLYRHATPLMTYEEQRIIETIKSTPELHFGEDINEAWVKENWEKIKAHAEKHAHASVAPAVPDIEDPEAVPF